jgi:hypothetical protein
MNLGFTLAKDETVIRKVRRHWVALAPVIVAAVFISFATVGMTYLYSRYRNNLPSTLTPTGLFVFDALMIGLAIALVYAGFWINARNFLVLTNQHLVRVEQRGLFSRSVSQLSLSRVQDVSGNVPGFIATVLAYGDLTVETAGTEDNFVFSTIYAPAETASACLKAHEDYVVSSPEAAPVSPPPRAQTMSIPTPSAVQEPAQPVVEEAIIERVPVPAEAVPPAHPDGPISMTESVTEKIEHVD